MGACGNNTVKRMQKSQEKEWKIVKGARGNTITRDYQQEEFGKQEKKLRKDINQYFDMFDSNGDGYLSLNEV